MGSVVFPTFSGEAVSKLSRGEMSCCRTSSESVERLWKWWTMQMTCRSKSLLSAKDASETRKRTNVDGCKESRKDASQSKCTPIGLSYLSIDSIYFSVLRQVGKTHSFYHPMQDFLYMRGEQNDKVRIKLSILVPSFIQMYNLLTVAVTFLSEKAPKATMPVIR